MSFECPECHSNKTLQGAIFETCAGCGYCSVDGVEHIKMLTAEILEQRKVMEGLNLGLAAVNGEYVALRNAFLTLYFAAEQALSGIDMNGRLVLAFAPLGVLEQIVKELEPLNAREEEY